MQRSILRKADGLRRDERGASLIEFAIAAPVFVMMMLALVDTARGFTEIYSLQQAVNRTLELAQYGSPTDDFAFLPTKASEAAVAAGVDTPTVTVDKWLECNGNKDVKKGWTETCPDGQQIARYISLKMNAKFKPIFVGSVYPGANADKSVSIGAKGSVRVQ